jgi:hypothetical protein
MFLDGYVPGCNSVFREQEARYREWRAHEEFLRSERLRQVAEGYEARKRAAQENEDRRTEAQDTEPPQSAMK